MRSFLSDEINTTNQAKDGLADEQALCTGFEGRGRVFRWFLGLTATFGLGPTTVLVLRSVGGCLGGFRVLWLLLVSVQQLCTGFEVRGRVFRWFSGLTATFGLGPTTVYWF